MKKHYFLTMILGGIIMSLSILLQSCTSDDSPADTSKDNEKGGIYGIVTNSSMEPMRGFGVELWTFKEGRYGYNGLDKLISRTITFDDGHYEFNDILPGEYILEPGGYVDVLAGKRVHFDFQVLPNDNND